MNTFTKFDQIGAVLSELSHHCVSLNMTRDRETGAISHWTVYVHPAPEIAFQGIGNTPSDALVDALKKAALEPMAAVEAAAGRELAA